MVKVSEFGKLPDGRSVMMYTLTNGRGEYAEILNFGASIHSLFVKDRNGVLGDVVLGVTTAAELPEKSLLGVVVGRVANRIAYGKCVLDGKPVQLEVNRGDCFLHGGSGNYAFRLFEGEANDAENSVTLSYRDQGEGGFGDCVDCRVTYTFTEASELKIHYWMKPEATTILSPTNHAYFNLSDFGDIRQEVLTLHASRLATKGPSGAPEGGTTPVAGTVYDFTSPRQIAEPLREDVSNFSSGHKSFDDFYVRDDAGWGLAAELYAPDTGRRMKVYTDMQGVILFTPDFCSKRAGKRGVKYPDYAAVCLETQFVPNAVNLPEFESPVFHAGEVYESTTIYQFSADE